MNFAGDSSLIKAAKTASVRPLFDGIPSSMLVEDRSVPPPENDELSQLMAKLAERDLQIAEHVEALAKAFAEGEDAGRSAAENDFEDSRAEALAALEKGMIAAREDFAASLEKFEQLAVQVALEALEILVDDKEAFSAILRSAISRQLSAIDAATIVSVTVSRSDFPDSRELSELEAALSAPASSLRLSDDLPVGNCRIALKVGTVELDLARSWREISGILSESGGGIS